MEVTTCDEFSILPRLGMERLHTTVCPTSTLVLNAEDRKEDSISLLLLLLLRDSCSLVVEVGVLMF